MEALLRQAERRGRPREARELRRQLDRDRHGRLATKQRVRIDGLQALALWLSKWAQGEQLHPWWQIDEPPPDELARIPADRQYQSGAKVFTVTHWPGKPDTLSATGMLNLGACFERDELNRLRVCVEGDCRRYFYAKDLRQKSCSLAYSRRRDGPKVAVRMERWRRKEDEATKKYALATLPQLSIRTVRALVDRGVLGEWAIDVMDGLREKLGSGIPPDQIWKRSGVRTRALFKKLQNARVG